MIAQRLRALGAGGAAITAAYLVTSHLEALPSTFLTALLLAGGSVLSGRATSAWRLWTAIGAGCGGLLGTAMVVADRIQDSDPRQGLGLRLAMVLCLMVAGMVGGRSLSLDAAHPQRRPPKDTLRSASALTTGIFAVAVTITFVHAGLDQARTVSSRLSTALTILVLSLSGPGWLVHLLGRVPGSHHRDGHGRPTTAEAPPSDRNRTR